jgi:hypothetical protein
VLEAVLREAVANMLGYSGGMGRHFGGVGGPDLGPMGLGGPRLARDVLLVPDLHLGVLRLDSQHEVVWGGDPRLGGGGPFSPKVGWPAMVIQATTVRATWYPMKTEPRRRSWRTMTTYLIGCCFLREGMHRLHFSRCSTRAASGETLDPGLLDRMVAAPAVVTPLEGIILEHMSTGGGATPGGNPRSGYHGSDDGDTWHHSPRRAIVYGAVTG